MLFVGKVVGCSGSSHLQTVYAFKCGHTNRKGWQLEPMEHVKCEYLIKILPTMVCERLDIGLLRTL